MPDQDLVFPVPAEWKGKAWIDEEGYHRAYERSLRDRVDDHQRQQNDHRRGHENRPLRMVLAL